MLTPLLLTPSLIRTPLDRNGTLVSFGGVDAGHAAREGLADEPDSGGPDQPGAVAGHQGPGFLPTDMLVQWVKLAVSPVLQYMRPSLRSCAVACILHEGQYLRSNSRSKSTSVRLPRDHLVSRHWPETSFSPITPARMRAMQSIRRGAVESPSSAMPTIAEPAAPMPVHTA